MTGSGRAVGWAGGGRGWAGCHTGLAVLDERGLIITYSNSWAGAPTVIMAARP